MANTFTYLHLETLRVHNSSSENYKNSNKKPAHGPYAPSWLTEVVRYAHALSPVEKSQVKSEVTSWPMSHECDNKQTKNSFCCLKFALNSLSRVNKKNWLHDQ